MVDSSGSTSSIYNEDDTFLNKYSFDRPIDVNQLEKVVINGEIIGFESS